MTCDPGRTECGSVCGAMKSDESFMGGKIEYKLTLKTHIYLQIKMTYITLSIYIFMLEKIERSIKNLSQLIPYLEVTVDHDWCLCLWTLTCTRTYLHPHVPKHMQDTYTFPH